MEALQHYRTERGLQPLFSHLDELAARVEDTQSRFGGSAKASANAEPSAGSRARELESLPLPSH